MNWDPASLLVSFVISGVGFVLFSYGRKMHRMPQLAAGVLLLVFPYFVPGIGWMLATAATILAALWGAVWYGL